MSRSQGSELCRIGRQAIAAPHHVQIGPQQQEIMAENIAWPFFINFDERKWRAEGGKGLGKPAGICSRTAETQKRIAIADMVMQCGTVG